MSKHIIIRTSIYHDASDYRSNVSELINHLDKGWKIISSASVGETRVEYVLQLPDKLDPFDHYLELLKLTNDPRLVQLGIQPK